MESKYRQLQRKLNTIGTGLPESDRGYDMQYLPELFSEEELDFALKMDRGLHTAQEVADSVGMPLEETQAMLEQMSSHGTVYNVKDEEGVVRYYLLPSFHGIFEFNVHRADPAWIKPMAKHMGTGLGKVFFNSEVPMFRYLPVKPELVENDQCLEIDNVESVLRKQDKIAVISCFCRVTSKTVVGENVCKANPPEDYSVCLVFNEFADFYMNELGIGRIIDINEALDIMGHSVENKTMSLIINTKNVEAMCNCCGCCCGVLGSLRKLGPGRTNGVMTNYEPQLDLTACIQCGKCAEACPTRAYKMVDDTPVFNAARCLGCGLCAAVCETGAIKLVRKAEDKLYSPQSENYVELLENIGANRHETGFI